MRGYVNLSNAYMTIAVLSPSVCRIVVNFAELHRADNPCVDLGRQLNSRYKIIIGR
jgi:hypothetical protein